MLSNLKELAISDSGLVFNPTTGAIATSNATGVQILRALCEGKTASEIVDQLSLIYDAPRETLERDVRDFLTQLQSQGSHE